MAGRRELTEKDKLILDKRVLKAKGEMKPHFTYRDLLEHLQKLDVSALDQQVEVLPPHNDGKPVRLHPVLGVNTVKEYCHVGEEIDTLTRSTLDFEHHPEQVVLLTDGSPFSVDGDTFFTLKDGNFVGNKTGKIKPFIKRHKEEPSVELSRGKAFQSRMTAPTKVLIKSQEELSLKYQDGTISLDEAANLDSIQAELYRRRYQLPEKK